MDDLVAKAKLQGALTPARFVVLLQRLGPVYLKIGQFLAVRPDLIPQEYCDALLDLTDAAERLSWNDVHAVISEELGQAPEIVFARFDRVPLAAASLAQVHRARTRDGLEVAVKVQRPGVAARVAGNIRSLRRLLRAMQRAGLLTGTSTTDLADELTVWLAQELDFVHERLNMSRAARLFAAERTMRVPRVVSSLSTSRVLVQEYLPGMPCSEMLRSQRSNPGALDRLGIDRTLYAKNIILSLYTQIFHYRFFHSDPHPGNLLILPGSVVGFVDFGLCNGMTEADATSQANFVAAAYAGDLQAVYRELMKMLIAGPGTDEDSFRQSFMATTGAWLRRRSAGTEPPSRRSSFARYLVDLMREVRRHDLRLPADLLALYRTLLTGETVAAELSPEVDMITVGRTFFASEQMNQLIASITPQRIQSSALDAMQLSVDAPGKLSQLLSDLSEDRFVLRVRSEDSAADRHLANLRARLVGIAIVSVGLAVFSGLALIAEQRWLAAVSGAILATAWVSMALIWRKLR